MILHGLPILFALALWWLSTGLILYLDGRAPATFRWSMAGGTLVAALAIVGLTRISTDVSLAGAYGGFAIGLTVWGWLELGYYMGFMVGPRRTASPPGCTRWQHFLNAAGTTLYHELAALALTAVIAAVSWDMPNKVALWTFVILWWMQLSAKLNVFLGVRNLAETFLPDHLAFLQSFMTRKPMNAFFPLSVTASIVGATLLATASLSAHASAFEAASLTMLAGLMVLAIVEHWFLVTPLPLDGLWNWSLRSRPAPREEAAATSREPSPDIAPFRPTAGQVFPDPSLTRPVTPFN